MPDFYTHTHRHTHAHARAGAGERKQVTGVHTRGGGKGGRQYSRSNPARGGKENTDKRAAQIEKEERGRGGRQRRHFTHTHTLTHANTHTRRRRCGYYRERRGERRGGGEAESKCGRQRALWGDYKNKQTNGVGEVGWSGEVRTDRQAKEWVVASAGTRGVRDALLVLKRED